MKIAISALFVGLALTGAALAQPTQPPATPVPPGTPQTIPEKKAPGPADVPGTLSDKLDKSDGVIKPQGDVDPAIHKPAPMSDPGNMPVVRPPEDKGGPVAK